MHRAAHARFGLCVPGEHMWVVFELVYECCTQQADRLGDSGCRLRAANPHLAGVAHVPLHQSVGTIRTVSNPLEI